MSDTTPEFAPEPAMEKVYDPQAIEAKWAEAWAAATPVARATASARPDAPAFSMVIPPPNVTGALHLGHALNVTLQDILARWRRMCGDDVLWIPGTDHAGIATQNVVERQLAQNGETRHDIGRDAFIRRVWEWKAKSGGTIIGQLKRLGASCNWEQERFTMDEGSSSAVTEAFVRLYQEGLIYRANRLINFCFRCNTALSDIEVEHEERDGKMYHIRYPLVDDPTQFLVVATTRPETMLADMAVAVHPDDPRYNKFIGKEVALPLTTRTIPIVGDAILVDREFGTGAVKITPGHDFNDEKAGKRHGLKTISLPALEDRKTVVMWLEEKQFLVDAKDHRHAVGVCYRCKTIVEPHQSTQWFVSMDDPQNSLVKPAIDAVLDGRIRLIPEGWKNNYLGWMENIQDWCISRQIWWGHQIPVWYCKNRECDDEVKDIGVSARSMGTFPFLDKSDYYIGEKAKPIVQAEPPSECPRCKSRELIQDPDVLDTWFSSALWPFSTLGWPKETEELKRFYPTNTLISGFDILFFWVARMMMMGLHLTKDVPFRDVYIHALVRDAEGQKMSKSKGNVVDPLEIMSQYGTDALRFTLASMASPGRDIRLSEERIEGYRNFANKIWNAARFIQMNAPEVGGHVSGGDTDRWGVDGRAKHTAVRGTSPADRWIIGRLRRAAGEVNQKLTDFRFDEAATAAYQFVWHEFCDWYLELAKVDLQDAARKEAAHQTMSALFGDILKLLHPFMPFITEELGQTFVGKERLLATMPYPKAEDFTEGDEGEPFEPWVIEPVTAIRNLRGSMNIPPSEALPVFLKYRDTTGRPPDLSPFLPYLIRLARLESVTLAGEPPAECMTARTSRLDLFIPISEAHRRAEICRLEKEFAKLDREREPLQKKRSDPNFAKAPQAVQEQHRLRAALLSERLAKIADDIARLGTGRA